MPSDTVFISYARADDNKPPFEETTQGWVTFFWNQLRFELTDRGAKHAELWLDRYQIDQADAFTSKIEQALIEARMLIAIFSENWVQSGWCQEEIDYFGRIHSDASERIVPIYKSDLDQKLLPVLIQGYQAREGYRFFTLDDTGRIHEFYWRGLKDRDAYFDLIRKIALFIIEKTGITPAKPVAALQPPVIAGSRKTVFVAVAAADLKDARQRLVNDLKASGAHVVPEDNALPETSEALEQALNQALSEAEYAIHLIGESRGFTAEGATDPIVDQQLKLARKSGVSRILWVPRWLPNQKDKPRDPFEVLQQRFAGLQPQEEIHHGEVTDLSQWLRQRLQPTTPAVDAPDLPVSYHRVLVASAHADDEELTADLAHQMQACGFSVKLYFSDDGTMPAQDLVDTLVWIPWGNAGVTDLESILDKLVAAEKIVCLRLPGGDEKAKRRFLKEKILVKKIDQLPADRSAIQALLDSLNITVQSAPTGEKV